MAETLMNTALQRITSLNSFFLNTVPVFRSACIEAWLPLI